MAWEKRGSKGRFYYRARKVDGQVVKEFVGQGPAAENIAKIDAQERVLLAKKCETFWASVGDHRQCDAIAGELNRCMDRIVRAGLLAIGYHVHSRSSWRKRRERTTPAGFN